MPNSNTNYEPCSIFQLLIAHVNLQTCFFKMHNAPTICLFTFEQIEQDVKYFQKFRIMRSQKHLFPISNNDSNTHFLSLPYINITKCIISTKSHSLITNIRAFLRKISQFVRAGGWGLNDGLNESPNRTPLFVMPPAVVNVAADVRAVKVSCSVFPGI